MAGRAERALLAPAVLRRIRLEAALVLVLLVAAFHLYGEWWPVLVAALLGRAFLISFLDNAAHYDAPLADPAQGYDLRAPRLVRTLVLNANFHGTHHRWPNLPWSALPEAFERDGGRYHGRYLLWPWRQLRGPRPLGERGAVP